MAGSLNKVMLIGRLGKDPERREFDTSSVVTFSLATSEQWKDGQGQRQERTQWHQISVWNQALGEIATNHLKKGSMVYLEGQLETRSWDKGGEKRYATEVVLRQYGSELVMLDRAPDRPNEPPAQGGRGDRNQPSGRN